ncbi:MAG: HTTM domain-containing protein [Myxococcales bacterium]|nr:HTTM domain-containing protein [Myxococcales bacterium]
MSARLQRWWHAWVDFWDEHEHPRSIALVRIALGLCVLYDFLEIWRLGLVVPLFGVTEVGGLSDALLREGTPLYYALVPATVGSAQILHACIVVAAISFTLGFFTRTSALVLVVAWSQFASILPYSDRGIDSLCRLVLTVFAFARAGGWLSVDAWIRTGTVWGDGQLVAAWPRRLLIGQLVLMYFSAGILKTGITWWPMGDFAALYYALQDPAVAAYDFSFARHQPYYFVTQLGTATTMLYQLTYPLVFLLMWWRRHPERAGRWGQWANRYRLEFLWIGTGATFHVVLAGVMNLGIFPWAMLALYPSWLHPDEWVQLHARLRRRWAA